MQAGAIRAGKAYVEVGADSAGLNAGLRAAQARLAAFGSAVRNVGAGMMGLGLGIIAPLAGAAKTFADFEFEMARVKSIIQPTTAEFEALNEEALRIGRDTVFSSSEAARAMVYFAQAGFSVKQMLEATGPAMRLAAANAITLEQATGASITILRGMGLSAADLERSLNSLGAVANASYTDVTLLASGFAYAAADARSAGMSLESVAAALGVLSNAGVRGERGGTGIRAILADFKNLTPQAAAELKRLGVALQTNGRWRTFGEIFTDLEKALKGVGNYAKDASLSKIFDTRSGSAASIILDNLKELMLLEKQAKNAGDVNRRMEAEQLDTLRGAWKLLTSSVEGFSLEVGKNLASVLRDVGAVLVPVANAAAKWAKENPELFQTILKVAAGITIAGAAVVALGVTLGAIMPVFTAIAAGFGLIGLAVKVYMNPTFLMLRQVASVVYALAKYTEVGKTAWKGLADLVSGIQKWAYEGLITTFNQMADSAKLAMTGVWDAIQGGDLEGALKIAGLGAWAVLEDLWANMKAGGTNAFSYIGSNFVKAFITASEAVANIFIGVLKFLADAWQVTWAKISGVWDADAESKAGKAIQDHADWAARKRAGVAERAAGWRAGIDQSVQGEVDARNKDAASASAKTREEIAALNAEAKRKRELAEFKARMMDMGPKMPGDMGNRLKTLGEGGLMGGKGEVSGTFNAALAGMMGATSINQQIADATKRTADATEKIARKDGGSFS